MSAHNRILSFLIVGAAFGGIFASGAEAAVHPGTALVGSAPVGQGPSVVALNPATHTAYVANGANPNGSVIGGNTVSVINTRHCNARDVSQCKGPWPTIKVGSQPSGIAIDQMTDTVYVSITGDQDVSVFNGATCNALNHSGCDQMPAKVPVGSVPIQIAADPANHTVYVVNVNDADVSMINSATCNAIDLGSCPHTAPPTVKVGGSPNDLVVDRANHTVYVTSFGTLNGWTVFDANTCNATDQAGCDDLGYLPGDPVGPNSAEVDTANNTLYTANFDNTVSAFGLADCNAEDLSGCATDTPGTVTPFPESGFENSVWLAVDQKNHSVYVVYQKDDTLIVINAEACNGADTAGCAALKPSKIHTGPDPESVVLDDRTQTLYTANQDGADVSVIDALRCDAETTSGCRRIAPTAPIPGAGVLAAEGVINTIQGSGVLAADPQANTTYVPNGAGTVSMIDTSACNADNATGCGATSPTLTAGTDPTAAAVDEATHTVYVTNAGSGASGTITVFNDLTCNAHDQSGCATTQTLPVPDGSPAGLAINPRTDTLYVATLTATGGANLISVYNGATCNAENAGGCNQTPANAPTGNDGGGPTSAGEGVAVNPVTNTVYAISDIFGNPFVGQSVYVIDGTTCGAADTSGCADTPPTITLGTSPIYGDASPLGIAVDQATDTVYTANIWNGEGPGTISVINGAVCNSQDVSGCAQTPATAPAGFGANGIAVDQTSNQVYATDIEDTSVTRVNGNICTGTTATGCAGTQTEPIVSDYPSSISIDPANGTAYVQTMEGVSVIPVGR